MNDQVLTNALARAADTREVLIGSGVIEKSGELLVSWFGGGPYKLVADQTTWTVAGRQVRASLIASGAVVDEPLIFPAKPVVHASYENCLKIRQQAGSSQLVAIGSGTLNDLVKLASHELGRSYGVVATAASMDGYTGFGAPISEKGVKSTRPCPAPRVAILDLDVVAGAPAAMTASGFGDLAAKIPGGADWILADVTGVEPIDPEVWQMVQGGVADALSRPDELARGVPSAGEGLVRALVLSGLAMQAFGGTRPASGAEHYFSHLWELDHLGADLDPPLSHGFKVAIGSLAMCAFHQALLARDLSRIDLEAAVAARQPWSRIEADIRASYQGALAEHALKETRVKYANGAALAARLKPLVEDWSVVATRLGAQLLPVHELADLLRRAGAPTHPNQIGVSVEQVRQTFPLAMYYRSRYTALDVAWELGIFDQLVDEVFELIW